MASFGDRLRELREERTLTQAQAAERAHAQPAAWSFWETSRRTPSLENLGHIIAALKLDGDDLFWLVMGG